LLRSNVRKTGRNSVNTPWKPARKEQKPASNLKDEKRDGVTSNLVSPKKSERGRIFSNLRFGAKGRERNRPER